MSSGVAINRTYIDLPADVSAEIMQKTQEESAVMRLARRIALPGRGVTIPVITGDPTAAWVAETAVKPVSNPNVSTKLMTAYKLAVIETFSEEFTRDAKALYDALISRLPGALSKTFDKTIIGAVVKPGDNFDTFANCTAQSLIPSSDHSTYDGLVAADAAIAEAGGVLNGFALSPQARSILLGAVDGNQRPLFINSVSEGAIPRILGQATYFNKGVYKAATGTSTPAIVGIAGDWTQAMFGTVEGVKIKITDQATVAVGTDSTINLWQQNMVAILAEIEVGFRADTSCFNLLTGKIAE